MDERVVIKSSTEKGEPLQAIFSPSEGMNLISFKKGDVEIIDQSAFLASGVIGPHCDERAPHATPHFQDDVFKSHLEKMQKMGYQDPFAGGVGRFADWHCSRGEDRCAASLSDRDQWNGISLKAITAQSFQMRMSGIISSKGLQIELSVVSDSDSLVGIEYRYQLQEKQGVITSDIQEDCFSPKEPLEVPKEFINGKNTLKLQLNNPINLAFMPFQHARQGNILLETKNYKLKTSYVTQSQENAWILKVPSSLSYVSICPVSAKNPWHPNLTVSSIQINLEIL